MVVKLSLVKAHGLFKHAHNNVFMLLTAVQEKTAEQTALATKLWHTVVKMGSLFAIMAPAFFGKLRAFDHRKDVAKKGRVK